MNEFSEERLERFSGLICLLGTIVPATKASDRLKLFTVLSLARYNNLIPIEEKGNSTRQISRVPFKTGINFF